MKKITLQEAYLHEKDDDADFRGKVNKELGGFKSILNDDEPKSKPSKVNDVNKELDKAKWELTEEIGSPEQLEERHGNPFAKPEGFDVEPENPFADAVAGHQATVANNKFNTKPEDAFSDSYNSSVKESMISVDEMDPMDELEHVSLVIHPTDGSEQGMDPLMTPMGGCDSEDASVSTFAAAGGPDFEKTGMDGDAVVLVDGMPVNKEAAWTFSPEDVGADDHMDNDFNDDFGMDSEEENDDWLSYLVEPEMERHSGPSNDMKGSVGTQGAVPTAVTTPTKPTIPTKECVTGMTKMKENVNSLKNQLSDVRKSLSKPEQIKENIDKLKIAIKNIK